MGRVVEQYGKLVRASLDDGYDTWVLAVDLEPPATPSEPPPDPCSVELGDRVRAPWARLGKLYAGRVIEIHGRFAHVRFDDGDKTWAACDSMRAHEHGGG